MRRVSFRSFAAALALAAAVLTSAACDSGEAATPINPSPLPPVTDTFTGTLTINGASIFTFTSLGAGGMSATLKTLGLTDTTIPVGFGVGVWNGTTCQITLANENAFQGTVILGSINGVGVLCARVADVGKLVESASFEIIIVHP